tara:strand:+ start:23 stop:763 length:741 start_codon:yes stop_codon:yes gene_type:complete
MTCYSYIEDIVKNSRKILRNRKLVVPIIVPKEYGYRVGDMFLKSFWRKEGYGGKDYDTGDDLTGEEYHLKYFPDSIASEYMLKSRRSNNYTIMSEIIKARSNSKNKPQKNTLIIHLRVGDVIDDSEWNSENVTTLLTYGSDYVLSLNSVRKALNCARRKSINNVKLVYGFHTKGKFNKSKLYLACLYTYCKENGFKVELLTQPSADDALIYMSNATLFAQSGGGFSYMISRLVKRNGGKVCMIRKR